MAYVGIVEYLMLGNLNEDFKDASNCANGG